MNKEKIASALMRLQEAYQEGWLPIAVDILDEIAEEAGEEFALQVERTYDGSFPDSLLLKVFEEVPTENTPKED